MYLNYIHKSIDNGEIVGAGEHLDDFFYNFYKPNQLASIFMYYMQFDDNAPIDFHAKMYAISATVTVSVGTAPYDYEWNTNPVQTTQTATDLAAGTYTVTITDWRNVLFFQPPPD